MPLDTDVTRLLIAWSDGTQAAGGPLMDAVYDELRRLARSYLVRERRNHSLPATALVNEAYLKLVDQRRVRWQNRAHFFAIAAHVMRRVLVDHARSRGAVKRDGGQRVPLQDVETSADRLDVDVLDLDAALEKLSMLDPRQSELVELRFFGGLTLEEAADVLGLARSTASEDWRMARAWLYDALKEEMA